MGHVPPRDTLGIVRWFVLLALTGCGRSGFDATDARTDSTQDGSSAYRDAVLADQPVSYFRLGEAGGPYAHSETGSAMALYVTTNDMIRYGRASVTGDGDTAVQFDGVGNLEPPSEDIAALDLVELRPRFTGDFTIEALVYPIGVPSDAAPYAFLLCENYLTNGFRTGWLDTMRIQVWNDEANGATSIKSQRVLAPDTWQHVVIAKEGATFTIYIDGSDAGTGDMPDYVPPDSNAECGMGSFHGTPSHAIFDELAIYTRALPAARVAVHSQLATAFHSGL